MSLIVYTKSGCPWCREVLAFLTERALPFEEREVRSSQTYRDELVHKSGQEKTPTLDLNGEILADTDTEAVALFLKKRGVLQ